MLEKRCGVWQSIFSFYRFYNKYILRYKKETWKYRLKLSKNNFCTLKCFFFQEISEIFKLIQMVEIVQNLISRQYLLISRHIYQTGTATVTSAQRATWAWSWMWLSAPSSVQKIHDTVLRRTATLPTTQMRERYYARQGEQFWFLSKLEKYSEIDYLKWGKIRNKNRKR